MALDVLVVGEGQAGLVMGYHLSQRRLSFQIVDAGKQIGQAWRQRWDSLKLFTALETTKATLSASTSD